MGRRGRTERFPGESSRLRRQAGVRCQEQEAVSIKGMVPRRTGGYREPGWHRESVGVFVPGSILILPGIFVSLAKKKELTIWKMQ